MAAADLFKLSELADQVCLNIGDQSDITQAKARKWINRALVRFMEMGYWSWQRDYGVSVPTVSAQGFIQIPNTLKVFSLFMQGASQRRLVLMDEREFRARYSGVSSSGSPYIYTKGGLSRTAPDTLIVNMYPTPDAVYQLKADVLRPISLLVNDADDIRLVTGMPSNLVDLVIEMATAIGWKEIDDSDAATQMQEALQRLSSAYSDDQSEIEDRFIFREDGSYDNRYQDPVLPGNYD